MVKTLDSLYKQLCKDKSDINEHLPTLYEYASRCKHITEFGVRTGLSTVALINGIKSGGKVYSLDINKTPEVDMIGELVKKAKKNWTFIKHSTTTITIDPTDMLFIDTLHDYGQLIRELNNNHIMVKKYIVLHDTETFLFKGETTGRAGLGYAVQEFLQNHNNWKKEERYYNNNGLTILSRIGIEEDTGKEYTPLVCVYTAIYGDQDVLKVQPHQSMSVKFVCYTDNPDIECEPGAREQREIRVEQPHKHLHPRMQAKYRRTHPHEVSKDSKYTIRMDGTTRLLRHDSIEYLMSQFKEDSDIICYKHDDRDCIYDEATYSGCIEKYKGLPMQAQVNHYRQQGMPEHFGLTGTGLLITRNDWFARDFLKDRRTECLLWTYQDQLSFDYLVWRDNIKRQWFKENQFYNNPYVDFRNEHKHDL